MSRGRRMRHSARANQCLMYVIYIDISMAKGRPCGKTYFWHPKVTELIPEILDSVHADQGCDEEPHPFDTNHAADVDAGKGKPYPPVKGEWAKGVVS